MMTSLLRIELFAGLQLIRGGDEIITRFQTRKTAALLAYLAFHRGKVISREVLTDILWPDSDPVSSRNSFRVALTSLRRQLEPPTVPPGAILFADRASVQLNPAAFTTDVAEFDEAVRQEKNTGDGAQRVTALVHASDVYKGPLLLGWYDEWIDVEQTRLAESYAGVLRRLTAILIERSEYERALEYAHRAVHADPLREETNRNLMRLYAAVGQPAEAVEQYRKLAALLQSTLGAGPSAATRELLKQITAGQFDAASSRVFRVAPSPGDGPAKTWLHDGASADQIHGAASDNRTASATNRAGSSVSNGSIPLQFTRFFGRESELSDLRELLRPATRRLVTITGPGGIGKTRLSVELASSVRNEFYAGRAWVAPLAGLTDANQIPSALLAVMRLPQQPDVPLLDQLAGALGAQPSLLVLDNVEQMVEGAHSVVQNLLLLLENVTILTTSRQRLDISGECDYPLAPLPVPTPSLATADGLTGFASVALFVDRARNARPDFQVTPRNSEAIAEVCRRLDGLPLALELAAASIRLLSPVQMLERLRSGETAGSSSADLLSTERREFSARHRSLRTVMDDSYALLSDDLRQLFAQLSVFQSGWSLHAAEMVCSEIFALDLLDLLNHRSLVVTREHESGMRFSFLETIRQYSESKLTDTQKIELKSRHSLYYSNFARTASSHLNGLDADVWHDLVELEHNNLRAAILYSVDRDPLCALRICSSLWRYWYVRGYAAEGLVQMEKSLRAVHRLNSTLGLDTQDLRFGANHGAGRLALSLGNTSVAANYFSAALNVLDEPPLPDDNAEESDVTRRAMLMNDLAITAEALGDSAAAETAYRELVRMYRSVDDPWAEACALSSLGAILDNSGRSSDANDAFYRSAQLRTQSGDWWGATEAREHPTDAMRSTMDPSLGAVKPSNDRAIAASYLQLGHIATERGDDAAAIPLLRDAVSAYDRANDSLGAALANERIAIVSYRQCDLDAATRAINDALLLRGTVTSTFAAANAPNAALEFTRRLLQKIERRGIA